jgi:hypothetical protein
VFFVLGEAAAGIGDMDITANPLALAAAAALDIKTI